MNIRKPFYTISISALALFTTLGVAAEPSLKEIMQDLRDSVVEITDGLLTDDFDRVVQGAIGIAQHAPISATQAKLISTELGPEMGRFKQFDEQVHALSVAIAAAAEKQDRDAVIVDYQTMMNGCLACHAAFKERVAQTLIQTP